MELTTSAIISLGPISTSGTSDTARFVASKVKQGHRQLQDSYFLGLRAKGVFGELYQTFDECREPNWDGYGAQPVLDTTCQLAQRFLEALPLGTPAPSIGAEPDGHVTVEWHRSPRWTLSISISPRGELHYAALLGLAKAYGTEPFFGEAPKTIIDLIHRVMAA